MISLTAKTLTGTLLLACVLFLISPKTQAEPTDICTQNLSGLSFKAIPKISGEGGCGIAKPIEVSAINGIELDPPARISCRAAAALRDWATDVLQPAANAFLGSPVVRLRIYASYVCRGRNRNPNAKLSEHALGNALDVGVVILADGREIGIAPRTSDKDAAALFQRAIRTGACNQFATVLGPGSDAYHDDHLHFDVAQRKNGYKLCQ